MDAIIVITELCTRNIVKTTYQNYCTHYKDMFNSYTKYAKDLNINKQHLQIIIKSIYIHI